MNTNKVEGLPRWMYIPGPLIIFVGIVMLIVGWFRGYSSEPLQVESYESIYLHPDSADYNLSKGKSIIVKLPDTSLHAWSGRILVEDFTPEETVLLIEPVSDDAIACINFPMRNIEFHNVTKETYQAVNDSINFDMDPGNELFQFFGNGLWKVNASDDEDSDE